MPARLHRPPALRVGDIGGRQYDASPKSSDPSTKTLTTTALSPTPTETPPSPTDPTPTDPSTKSVSPVPPPDPTSPGDDDPTDPSITSGLYPASGGPPPPTNPADTHTTITPHGSVIGGPSSSSSASLAAHPPALTTGSESALPGAATQNASAPHRSSVRTSVVAGSVVGSLILLALAAVGGVFLVKRWRRNHTAPSAMFKDADPAMSPFQRITESRISQVFSESHPGGKEDF